MRRHRRAAQLVCVHQYHAPVTSAADPISFSPLFKPTTPIGILDIGASHVGTDPPYKELLTSGLGRLIGFEPNEAACEKLRQMFGPPHQFFPYFIGDGKAATYYETNWVATGSLFRPNTKLLEKFNMLHELTTPVAEHPVQTTRLDDVQGIGDVDFIKLDIQGSELSVLQNAQRVLKDATVVQVEVEFVPMYENQPLFADVDIFMRSQGFAFHAFPMFGSRCFKPLVVDANPMQGLNQCLWSDATYVRDWMKLDELSPDKLGKFAVLCADIIKSPDLCLHILTHLDARSGSTYCGSYLRKLQGK
ncbi:MAG: FkbM family methyltransferase [Planctomycetes bacterium]|nr:FkbM family methyltransferase [Planctomycetota bacterium]